LGKSRRGRKRTKNILAGSKWGGVDTVMTIGALGVVGFIGYFMLKSGKGAGEFLQTGGDVLKKGTDLLNEGAEYLSKESSRITGFIHGAEEGRKGALESIGNTGCHIQRGFGLLLSPFGVKPVDCRGAGGWRDNNDDNDEPSRIVRNIGNIAGKPSLDDMIANALKPRGRPIDHLAEGVMGLGCGVWRKC
jgi:hypothetical protein